jgi:hypothetical protein
MICDKCVGKNTGPQCVKKLRILERCIEGKRRKTGGKCIELSYTKVNIYHWRSRHAEQLGIALSISPNSADIPHIVPEGRNRSSAQNIPLTVGILNY